jgi:transcriptional regulator with XRE-family HTH domain
MAPASNDPAVQRRRLRVELRAMRKETGKTQRDVAQAMDWSLSKMIRIENGEVGISPNDLRALLTYYGIVDPERVEPLVILARSSHGFSWSDLRDVYSPADLTYFGFESAASLIRSFELTLVTGLLQTEEYGRAVLRDTYRGSSDVVERRWLARQRRQELHELDTPPTMFFVLDEAVIRRRVGGSTVMRRQLERLKEWSARPHVSLQVLPFEAGAHPALTGPFVLLEFDDPHDDDVLYQEHATGGSTTRDNPNVTGSHVELFFHLEASALSPGDTVAMIDDVIEEMKGSRVSVPKGVAD